MKKLIMSLMLASALLACKSQQKEGTVSKEEKNTEKSETGELQKKITKRNTAITAANAYSDIFFDSLALEKFFVSTRADDTIIRRMRSFYNARNYQYAWFASNGLTEQARGFWNLQSYYTTINKNGSENFKALSTKMERLETAENMKVSAADNNVLQTELLLTQHFIIYMLSNYKDGTVKRKEMEKFIPLEKANTLQLADSILTKKHKDNKYYEDENTAYKALKVELQKYYTVAKNGGWPLITGKQYKIGMTAPAIINLKKRLQVTGEMPADTTAEFNSQLEAAVKNYQTALGLTATGVVSESLIKDMNIPAIKRVQQILINMDRMRWMPEPEGNLMLVNIPEFVLHVFEGKKEVFNMGVVVGKEGHNTMMFKGDMNQVVFSPYWNITPSIAKAEILPAIAKDPGYLASHNMEMTPDGGIRQLPGEKNSLGKVKFLFPNSFNIYFHDTPAKSLFSKDKRAYSHGCIRLSEPKKLAEYVLRDRSDWPTDKIDAAMNSGKETFVKLNKSVPVIITYYTAWVDENGMLNFRDDIYNQDGVLTKKMFTN